MLLSSTVRELLGKSPKNFRGSPGNFRGSPGTFQKLGEPDSLPATRQIYVQSKRTSGSISTYVQGGFFFKRAPFPFLLWRIDLRSERRKSAKPLSIAMVQVTPSLIARKNQRIAKGAGGKGPRQKTSKIVKKRQKVFRHFSTIFAQGKKRQKSSKSVKKFFDNFRAAPFSRPLLQSAERRPRHRTNPTPIILRDPILPCSFGASFGDHMTIIWVVEREKTMEQ